MRFWSGLAGVAVCAAFVSGVSGDVFNMPVGLTSLEFVEVGNPGNGADTTGFGAVGYTYNIGKYEVTAGQYTEFLNAVAATDTHGLYYYKMADINSESVGIVRNGSSGSFTYEVAPGCANRPVHFVSFWDAARFCNWLHNGQGGPETTESGAYINIGDQATFARQAGAKFFIPSEDEWYKAAYYKGGGTDTGYWLYPTQSDTDPGRDLNDISGNNANYKGDPYPIQSPYKTTVVGEFQDSGSAYGTFDQGGNVWEWNEAVVSSSRGLRGGSFAHSLFNVESNFRFDHPATGYDSLREYRSVGFRVASAAPVPEPASLAIWACGGLGALVLRRRRR
ncbi:MAG: SUMF1/EgtB/PvdO family nonheme iron enzyme [Planctomycetaceae bacterium]|nr:SUMF1/EgtB/PvdO family nonheme iron enzyme [Planctomycetaceae bacterium]